MSILDEYIRGELQDALQTWEIPSSAVITRMELSGPPWDPVSTPTDHPCQAWRDTWTAEDLADSRVLATDVKAYVVATSLIAPTTADTITLNGKTYSIVNVSADAATAAYVCQCRA